MGCIIPAQLCLPYKARGGRLNGELAIACPKCYLAFGTDPEVTLLLYKRLQPFGVSSYRF